MREFPGTLLNICQMPTTRPDDADELRRRQANLLSCVHAIAGRFKEAGIASGYHPNSPDSSIFRTREDYDVLLGGLDRDVLGWIPDVGHIARVDMDPLELIREHRDQVCHIHYKDMDAAGAWQQMGAGVIDFHSITSVLVETGYDGWIVVEDESDRAVPHPDEVTLDDWEWVKRELVPLLSPSS